MSKKLKKILGVVAAIAIPFAAPLIAGSAALAGVAGAIGTTATSALVGAGLGAANAAITGGNVAQGALMGGFGGGMGSLARAGSAASNIAGATDVARAAYPGAGGFTQGASLGSTLTRTLTPGQASFLQSIGGNTSKILSALPQGQANFLTSVGANTGGGFMSNLGAGLRAAGQNALQSITDPNNLLRAGMNIASEYAAAKAAKLTPQEQAMFNSLAEEQAWRMGITKEQYLSNKDLFDQAYAQVKQISPPSEGQRYAASVSNFEPDEIRKVRMATQTNQPNLLEARERDLGIQQAERRASAYERGYEGGRQAYLSGIAGLAGRAPGPGESVAGSYPQYYQPLQQASAERGKAAGEFVGGIGEIFFPKPKATRAGLFTKTALT